MSNYALCGVATAWSPASYQGELITTQEISVQGYQWKGKWILQKGTKKFVLRCPSRHDPVVVEGDLYILEVAGRRLRNFLKMGEASRLGKKGKSLTARHFSFGFGHRWL